MYLELGQSVIVSSREVLGIFDLDNASWAFKTREWLNRAEAEGRVRWLGDDLPRSLVLVGKQGEQAVAYLSQLSPAALVNRVENGF